MITCSDVISYMDDNYNFKGTLSELARNEKIKSMVVAYDFDTVKKQIYKEQCTSADALLIKKNLNLIEFKTGFDSPDESLSEQIKKENLKLSIRIKAYESLHLLQTAILDEISPYDSLEEGVKKVFCAVIDTSEPIIGEEAYVDIISDAGGVREHVSYKVKIWESILRLYRKETDKHKKLFYDEAFVLYDYEFDKSVGLFK